MLTMYKEFVRIVSRRWNRRDLDLLALTKQNLIELNEVVKEIERRKLPKKYVRKKLQGKIGYGIFLHVNAEPILKGQVIGPYVGKVSLASQNRDDNGDYTFDLVNDLLLMKEEQKRFDPKNCYHPRRLYSLKLDALKKGNFTRYINHSDKPNIEAHLIFLGSMYQIIYMAKKTIWPSEQLLISYEDGEKGCYWGAMGIKPYPMTPKTFRLNSSLKIIR